MAITKRWVESITLPENIDPASLSVTVEAQAMRFVITGKTLFRPTALTALDLLINLK
jgi:predicted ribosome-associated RNA-binding protein Tma20